MFCHKVEIFQVIKIRDYIERFFSSDQAFFETVPQSDCCQIAQSPDKYTETLMFAENKKLIEEMFDTSLTEQF